MHHGVKGMKWGVRKAYEPTGMRTRRAPADKARLGESTGIVRKLKKSSRKAERYEKLSNKREFLAKGSTVSRVSGRNNEKHEGSTYVTTKKDDWKNYVDTILFDNSHAYRYDYITKHDMFGPSEKERIDTFIDMYKDTKVKDLMTQSMKKATIIPRSERSIRRELDAMANKELGRKTQKKLSFMLNVSPEINSEYSSRMQKKGYSFVTDDFDIMSKMSETPTIILDRKKSLELQKVTQVYWD